jgi:hypothetical protein
MTPIPTRCVSVTPKSPGTFSDQTGVVGRAAAGRPGGQTPVTLQECPVYVARHMLFQLTGIDLVTMPGLKASTVHPPSRDHLCPGDYCGIQVP